MQGQTQDPMTRMLAVHPVPAFSDNYIWLLQTSQGEAFVVDPGDAAPVMHALAQRALRLSGILVTHHHPDHVGGVNALVCELGPLPVYGPRSSPATCIDQPLDDGDRIEVLGYKARVLAVPGHTLDHIAYFIAASAESPPLLFCGDTLFAGGCGRVFEGNPRMMYASLARLAELPGETRVYCAHEYTLSNLRFARAVEPDNLVLRDRQQTDEARRERGEPTVPSTMSLERESNPFLRCTVPRVRSSAMTRCGTELSSAEEVFAEIRSWKDTFR